jgi:hypothetical protein
VARRDDYGTDSGRSCTKPPAMNGALVPLGLKACPPRSNPSGHAAAHLPRGSSTRSVRGYADSLSCGETAGQKQDRDCQVYTFHCVTPFERSMTKRQDAAKPEGSCVEVGRLRAGTIKLPFRELTSILVRAGDAPCGPRCFAATMSDATQLYRT